MLYKIKAICLLLACCCIGSVGLPSSASETAAAFQRDLTEDVTFTDFEEFKPDTEAPLLESSPFNNQELASDCSQLSLDQLFSKIKETEENLDNITFQNVNYDTTFDSNGNMISESSSSSPIIRLEGIISKNIKLQYESTDPNGITTKLIFIDPICYCENSKGEKHKISLSKREYDHELDAIVPPLLETFSPSDFREETVFQMANGHYQITLKNPYGRIWHQLLAPLNISPRNASTLIQHTTDWTYQLEVDGDGNIYKKSVTMRIVENGSVRELKNELIFDEIGMSAYIGIPNEE